MFRWLTERRRRHILEHPFPPEWERSLERNVGAYHLLRDDERQRLKQLVQVLIAEKKWEGCCGLELTDEVRVTVAGQACLLILGRDHDLFGRVVSILIYPTAFLPPERPLGTFEVADAPVEPAAALDGQFVSGQTVLLSWDATLQGGRDPRDGQNVVLHEFAHAIDFLDGTPDGAPPLDSSSQREAWVRICSAAFAALGEASAAGRQTVLDIYGAESPAEFFAVATEAFFERSHELAREEPDLYGVLSKFYNLDLAARPR